MLIAIFNIDLIYTVIWPENTLFLYKIVKRRKHIMEKTYFTSYRLLLWSRTQDKGIKNIKQVRGFILRIDNNFYRVQFCPERFIKINDIIMITLKDINVYD